MSNMLNFTADQYDDVNGEVLRSIYRTIHDVPNLIKTATLLRSDELESLPDHKFAMIVVDGTTRFRKYACHDAGNTALSVAYFLAQKDRLSDAMVKVASSNLLEACELYSLTPPKELRKTASKEPVGRYVAFEPLKERKMEKTASSNYIVGTTWPIDSYEQVKTAEAYYSDNRHEMDPFLRHTFCTKLASRMTELGMHVPPKIEEYSHTDRSHMLSVNLSARKALLSEDLHPVIDTVMEKAASLSNDTLAEVIFELDKESGLSRHWGVLIADPVQTVYGPTLSKVAEEDWSWSGNGYIVRLDHLKNLSEECRRMLKKQFGEDFVEKFQKDPKKTFEGLSGRLKEIVARMAVEHNI